MADYGSFLADQELEEVSEQQDSALQAGSKNGVAAPGAFDLHSLTDDETIARLATGIQRFKLPDEFNYVKQYQQIAAESTGPFAIDALEQLAQIHENRVQYERAADYWRQAIRNSTKPAASHCRDRLDQIVGNWGRFEPSAAQPAGKGASLKFRFRNARQVHFEAREIKFRNLVEDVKAYLKSNPAHSIYRGSN